MAERRDSGLDRQTAHHSSGETLALINPPTNRLRQLKFTMIVCYLSTHINVVILTASIFACNAFVFVIWSRLMSTSRKAKQKYSNPNYEENEIDG